MENIKEERKKKRDINKIIKICGAILLITFIIILQIFNFCFTYIHTSCFNNYVRLIYDIIKLGIIVYILMRKDSASYKLSWIIIIEFIPLLGIIIYLCLGNSFISKKEKNKIKSIRGNSRDYLKENYEVLESIKDIEKYKNFNYLYKTCGYPIYKNEGIKYLPTGENFFEDVIFQLKQAKEYIFIDLYIYSVGDLMDKILDILYKKAASGVKVIIIMDDLGSKFKKPKNFEKALRNNNIEILKYNSSMFCVNKYFSYRDHRKIIIIDGKCAYTGGINIADEYINNDEKYGYWKDGGIKIQGTPINSYIVMFGSLYEEISLNTFEYNKYIKQVKEFGKQDGYIMNIEQIPANNKNIAENMYINFINSSEKYIYIATPYLILTEPILSALFNAARSGVKIKIVVPKYPDKIIINKATKSFYTVCLEAGIEIYEYNPGFIHSKMFLSDTDLSIVGSINFDYRSFNLNYECATISYKTGVEKEIKKDFDEILENSTKINLEGHIKRPFFEKVIEAISRLITPII